MKEEFKEEISTLIKKAAESHDSADAMRFSQAAQNITNALFALTELRQKC